MHAKTYESVFNQLTPVVLEKLAEIQKAVLEENPEIQALEVSKRGDEESILSLDFEGNSEFVVGVDFHLCEEDPEDELCAGLAIKWEMQGLGGEPLGTVIPENYTPNLYASDVGILKQRVIETNIQEIVHVLTSRISQANAPRPS